MPELHSIPRTRGEGAKGGRTVHTVRVRQTFHLTFRLYRSLCITYEWLLCSCCPHSARLLLDGPLVENWMEKHGDGRDGWIAKPPSTRWFPLSKATLPNKIHRHPAYALLRTGVRSIQCTSILSASTMTYCLQLCHRKWTLEPLHNANLVVLPPRTGKGCEQPIRPASFVIIT